MHMHKKTSKAISSMLVVMLVGMACNFNITSHAAGEISINSPAGLLMDSHTGKVLFKKNPHEIRVCASITKVMTLILVMEAIDSGKISFTDKVTASEHAASMGGSHIWLAAGEVMTVEELVKAVVVASANDGAVALAEYVSGSEEAFVKQMNEKAQSLGMKDTVFKNCNGLDEDGHVTCAYDVALMSKELMKHKEIFNYTSIWMEYLRDGKTQLVSTNKLLKGYNGITGLKTGTTSKAGSCISATAKRDNLHLISVVLGSPNGKQRFREAAELLNFGFANYAMAQPVINDGILEPIKVVGGLKDSVEINADISGSILVSKGSEKNITSSVEMLAQVEAPIYKGQVLGRLIYKLNDEIVAEYDITAVNDVEKITFGSAFNILFKGLIGL